MEIKILKYLEGMAKWNMGMIHEFLTLKDTYYDDLGYTAQENEDIYKTLTEIQAKCCDIQDFMDALEKIIIKSKTGETDK